MLWRCATYNPHSAWQLSRKQEILDAFDGYHVVGLCGTKYRKHSSDPSCRVSTVGSFRLYEWGNPGKSEHAAGLAICIRRQVFAEHNIRQIYDIPSVFQGRLGVLRVKRKDVDFCFIAAYPWVQGRTASERSRIDRFWQYVGSVISSLPHRCVPVVLTDANARNGLHRDESGAIVPIESPAIGACTREFENSSGASFRRMLEEQFLCSINSFRAPGHTYFGNVAGVKSRIDHIVLPQSLQSQVVSSGVLYSVGSRLQRVYGPGKRDHMPVNVVFRHASSFTGQAGHRGRKFHWDQSALVNGVLRGDMRRQLVDAVTRNCAELDFAKYTRPDCNQLPPAPDVYWKAFSTAIHSPAYDLYQRKKPSQQRRPADTQKALQTHAEAREVIAALPKSLVPVQDRQHTHQFLAELLFQWRAASKFYSTRAAADRLLKRDARKVVADRIVEFNHAHHARDDAHVWRMGRVLSGFRVGPKRRRYDRPLGSCPEAREWVRFMAQPGNKGGCSGHEVDWEVAFHEALTCKREPVRSLAAARSMATEDFRNVLSLLRVHRLRKVVPDWAVPGEIWRQLASPDEYYVKRRLGIGYDSRLNVHLFRQCLYGLFVSIRLYDTLPLHWNLSQTFQIDKQNSQPGCAGLRSINTFEPLGKIHIRSLWDRGIRRCERHWAAGYVKHKSRVTPIMQRRIVKARLRRAGQSHCDSFYDAKNAFPSVARPICDAAIQETCKPEDINLLKQRNNQAIMRFLASDRVVFIATGSGSLQGDSHAGEQFLEQYHPALDEWVQRLSNVEGSDLVVWDQIGNMFVDASISSYADDLARTVLCSTPHDLAARLHRANQELCDVLEPLGVAQNLDKQEHVPCFVRSHALSHTRLVFHQAVLPGRTKQAAKYLGSLHHATCNDNAEIDQRLRKADIGWFSMGKFWFRNGLLRASLVLVFKGLVYSTLLSGLEALCLSKSQLERLDTYVLRRGRQLMHGTACQKFASDGQITYKALPALSVWRFLQMVPAHIELRLRRLRFWQNVALHSELHAVLLGCLFSQFDFETSASVDAEGKPTAYANPWLRQLADDVQSLACLDSGSLLVTELRGRLTLLFTEYREDFVRVDVTEFRAQFLGHAVPPPGWVAPPQDVEDALLLPAQERSFTCLRKCADGTVCNKTFPRYSQLYTHMVQTKGGEHGERPFFALACVSNICPWCRCKFASRVSASHHIKRAFEKGRCAGRGSCVNPALEEPRSLACPACDVHCDFLDNLLQHMCGHDSPAAFFARQRQQPQVPAD